MDGRDTAGIGVSWAYVSRLFFPRLPMDGHRMDVALDTTTRSGRHGNARVFANTLLSVLSKYIAIVSHNTVAMRQALPLLLLSIEQLRALAQLVGVRASSSCEPCKTCKGFRSRCLDDDISMSAHHRAGCQCHAQVKSEAQVVSWQIIAFIAFSISYPYSQCRSLKQC